jgi:hypothetical protein
MNFIVLKKSIRALNGIRIDQKLIILCSLSCLWPAGSVLDINEKEFISKSFSDCQSRCPKIFINFKSLKMACYATEINFCEEQQRGAEPVRQLMTQIACVHVITVSLKWMTYIYVYTCNK